MPTTVVQEANVHGVSTRSVDDQVKATGMSGVSKYWDGRSTQPIFSGPSSDQEQLLNTSVLSNDTAVRIDVDQSCVVGTRPIYVSVIDTLWLRIVTGPGALPHSASGLIVLQPAGSCTERPGPI